MSNYDPGAIRRMLLDIFLDEEDFGFFCEDYFPEVPAKFTEGMTFKAKVQALNQHCLQNSQFDKLLPLLQKNYPAKYQEHSASLVLEGGSSASIAAPTTSEAPPPPALTTEPTALVQPATAPASSTAEPAEESQGQDVFISYSTKNLDFVQQLYQKLSGRGLSVWFDKQSIEGATQWRESIVTGIMNCKVFLLVLSPESAASDNVRKELDLAEHHKKKIFPLMWRDANPLPPSFQYQLAGTQYISFNGTPSEENFNKVFHVVNRLLGGSVVSEAASGERAIQAPGYAVQPVTQPVQTGSGRPERGRGTAQDVSAVATGTTVMGKVVNQMTVFTGDEKDAINKELGWVFQAAEHFLRVRRGQTDRPAPVPVPVPSEAKVEPGANNTILSSLDDFTLDMLAMQVQSAIKQINQYMRNLAIELAKEAQLGGAIGANLALTNSIKSQQQAIAKNTQELAGYMHTIYGVLVYGPDDVAKQLAA
ncbi:MAG: TIR domain-containing protein [Chloroflexi bacterium]|nr:TIR domain-containing protein [Chloroflexota bacterium]